MRCQTFKHEDACLLKVPKSLSVIYDETKPFDKIEVRGKMFREKRRCTIPTGLCMLSQ